MYQQQQQQELYRQQQQQELFRQQQQQAQFAAQQERQRLDAQRFEAARVDQQRERETFRRRQERAEDERRDENAAIQQRERDEAFQRQDEIRRRQHPLNGRVLSPAPPAPRSSGATQIATWNSIPKSLAGALEELLAQGSRIDGLAFTLGGGWLVLFDGNRHRASGVAPDVIKALRAAAAESTDLRSPAFGAAGSWVFLQGKNEAWGGKLPPQLEQAIKDSNAEGLTLPAVALTNESGLVIQGRNGWTEVGASQGLREALQRANSKNQLVDFVTLGPDGSWVLVKAGGREWTWSGVAPSLHEFLSRKEPWRVQFVALAPDGGWVVVTSPE